ncbi:MAG: hypothetical protein K9J85_11630 [Desulfobacteraceae bacterium]|nr:hypothetical protein [Desulfobacteraceae bacterium]
MEEQEGPRGFKIDFEEKGPETPPEEETPAKEKIKKPGKSERPGVRPVFIWLLAILVILGAGFFGYHRLDTRLAALESMSETGLQGLSGKIDERLTAISELVRQQRDQIKNRILETEKNAEKNAEAIKGIEKSLESVEGKLSNLETTFKGRIDKLEKDATQIKSEVRSEIKQNKDRLDKLAGATEKLAALETSIEKTNKKIQETDSRIEKLDRRISAMQQNRINEEELEQSLEQKIQKLDRSLQQQIKSETGNIRTRLNRINDQVQALEAMINALEDMQGKNDQQNSGSQKSSDSSGEIIEQELK